MTCPAANKNNRLFVLALAAIIGMVIMGLLFFISNAMWLKAWTSYDYETIATVVETQEGTANYIGGNGDINNGTNNQDHHSQDSQSQEIERSRTND